MKMTYTKIKIFFQRGQEIPCQILICDIEMYRVLTSQYFISWDETKFLQLFVSSDGSTNKAKESDAINCCMCNN